MNDEMILDAAKKLAFGRIMRMASRPTQPGDIADYERCRAILMTDAPGFVDVRPNYVRDRNKGAAGD